VEEAVSARFPEGKEEEDEAGEGHAGGDCEVKVGAMGGYGYVGCAAVYGVCWRFVSFISWYL
jgi:hypothetical protein